MALGPFFDKVALAASEVASGLGYAALKARLESECVAISIDSDGATGEGKLTAELIVSLLARLYPRVAFATSGAAADKLATELAATARWINPDIEVTDPSGATRSVIVGSAPVLAEPIYVGSHGGTAFVSLDERAQSGQSANPFGAGVAACVGVAQLFRSIFADVLPVPGSERFLRWHVLDLPQGNAVELRDVFLVGAGAIGTATAWALGRMPRLRGALHVVDGECVELSNVQRYVLTGVADVSRLKVDVIARALSRPDLEVIRHPTAWAAVPQNVNHQIGLAAVAVDSAVARCEVQASLPRTIVNAWTQPGDLGVSRHQFLGEYACLMCLYLPTNPSPSEDALIASAIGLPDSVQEVRQRLHLGTPIDRTLLARIAAAQNVSVQDLLLFEGRSLREFYSAGVCGGLLLRLGTGASPARAAATPLAHQSACAGILLAAEIVKHSLHETSYGPPPVSTRYDVLKPLTPTFDANAAKDKTGRCICSDPDFIAAFRSRYPV
jgi:molybdopterin/thiamine biosynthesis adenylyltransferase